MAIESLALPDLGVYTGKALLFEPWGFTTSGDLITAVAFLAPGQMAPQRAAFLYDSQTTSFSLNINAVLAKQLGEPSGDMGLLDVLSVQPYRAGEDTGLVVLYDMPGMTAGGTRLALIEAGVVRESSLMATLLPGAELNIARAAVSADGRFVALQTTANLLPDELFAQGLSDANEAHDVYVLDRVSGEFSMVSTVAGDVALPPSVLGDLRMDGATLRISFVTEASLDSADTNADTEAAHGPGDAYVWSQAFDAAGWVGSPSISLLSQTDGAAMGGVELAADGQGPEWAGPLLTAGPTYVNTSSPQASAQDSNNAVDALVVESGSTTPLTWTQAPLTLSQGAQVVAASNAGQIVALLSSSPEVAGPYGANKLLVIDRESGEAQALPSDNLEDQTSPISAALSPDGARVAYAATSVNGDPQVFLADTGFIDQAAGSTVNVQVNSGIRPEKSIPGVSFEGHSEVSDAQGQVVLSGVMDDDAVADDRVTLQPSKAAPSRADASISLTDVLGALKVYLGKPLDAAYDSDFKYVAADFDANGRVDLSDVLGLLKYYLGKPVEAAPEWVFADAAALIDGQAASDQAGQPLSKAAAMPAPIEVDVSPAEVQLDLVGILRGDVDGSWSPPVP